MRRQADNILTAILSTLSGFIEAIERDTSMASRRGAMKVNPVTGKMEKMDEKEAGLQRDGCLVLPEKYMNAAKDLGLGGAGGAYWNGHL